MAYNAIVKDENGTDLGPLDQVSGAQNDAQALDLAKQAGLEWMTRSGMTRATVQVSQDGRWLAPVQVQI
jgi:hypothetical protein